MASGKRIKLTFESFDVENHSSCTYDFVQISFASGFWFSTSTFEEKYCGANKPNPIISSGNSMEVVFHSDGSTNGNGFKAIWEAIETGKLTDYNYVCSCRILIKLSGEIQSPNYPGAYDSNLDEVSTTLN